MSLTRIYKFAGIHVESPGLQQVSGPLADCGICTYPGMKPFLHDQVHDSARVSTFPFAIYFQVWFSGGTRGNILA
jgi:hypothetical protein